MQQSCRHIAPAKLNVSLEIVGRRNDGYHELVSLVMFVPEVADVVTCRAVEVSDIQLDISGEYGESLLKECPDVTRNLAWRAAHLLQDYTLKNFGMTKGVHLHLEKKLPSQAGIGGGSADAAAVLRGVNEVWQLGLSLEDLAQLGAVLGADVPMCVFSRALVASGVGDVIAPIDQAYRIPVIVVKPNVALSTPQVFRVLNWQPLQRDAAPLKTTSYVQDDLLDDIKTMRNDLSDAAITLAPEIAQVLAVLEQQVGGMCARMSGSGSACFAVFDSYVQAENVCAWLQENYPSWWSRAGYMV
jgi:4-diphosphocytidyl-2-C-methyl-D-erythritol kinase